MFTFMVFRLHFFSIVCIIKIWKTQYIMAYPPSSECITCRYSQVPVLKSKSQLVIISCFYKILSVFFTSDEKQRTEKNDEKLVRDISRYIELNISNDVSMDSLCKSFGYSRTALFEKFKQAKGVSIKNSL